MRPTASSRWLRFAVMSVALHAATWLALGRGVSGTVLRTFDPDSHPLIGETLDIEPSVPMPTDSQPTDPTSTLTPTPTLTPAGRASGTTATIATAPPAVYGAVGVHFASDLATTFTRAFPQAASGEALWSSVPFGNAGRTEVTLVLNDEGHLERSEVAGSPSAALRRSIERTLALLGPRAFTARGALTRLSVIARVSADDVHDGLHGDVFALSAGSFAGEIGTAFFALPPATGPGRRVDVEVRLLP
ncbi:MAG: hypothetical protein M3O46_06430 [Myxococcota bacterium]|nr:hypothetical protein [Myxococcota bacterium]